MWSFLREAVFLATNRATKEETTVTTRDNYWGIWQQIRAGSFSGEYLEVDLDDMCTENRLLGVIGRDVAPKLHLPSTKCPIHYLVDSEALISMSEMGNGIPNRNKTTCPNTDTRTNPAAFYEPAHNHQVDIRGIWG